MKLCSWTAIPNRPNFEGASLLANLQPNSKKQLDHCGSCVCSECGANVMQSDDEGVQSVLIRLLTTHRHFRPGQSHPIGGPRDEEWRVEAAEMRSAKDAWRTTKRG